MSNHLPPCCTPDNGPECWCKQGFKAGLNAATTEIQKYLLAYSIEPNDALAALGDLAEQPRKRHGRGCACTPCQKEWPS